MRDASRYVPCTESAEQRRDPRITQYERACTERLSQMSYERLCLREPIWLTVGQHPIVDVTVTCVTPHDVGHTIVVEIADTDRDRTRGVRSDVDAARPTGCS